MCSAVDKSFETIFKISNPLDTINVLCLIKKLCFVEQVTKTMMPRCRFFFTVHQKSGDLFYQIVSDIYPVKTGHKLEKKLS